MQNFIKVLCWDLSYIKLNPETLAKNDNIKKALIHNIISAK